MQRDTGDSIESRTSWRAAFLTLAILSLSFGSPLLAVVGLRDIQAAMHTDRSVISLASSLVWIGNGVGGIPMGWLADRIGIRKTVAFGTLSMTAGMALSSTGSVWALYVGHGLLVGFLGNGAIYAPLMIYVSRWFDRRRGTALALISSGQYIAGMVWPSIMEVGIKHVGWQAVMLGYGAIVLAILPLLTLLRQPPDPLVLAPGRAGPRPGDLVLGFRPNMAMVLICIASFCCCVPMAIPSSHLVAFCGDLGIPASHGAAMLSVMLACAFISRQFWGALADRFGGLRTVMAGSALQALAIGCFLLTRDEAGLFAVASAFGFGFSGIIPSYSVAIRDLYPSKEASWRIPTVLMTAMSGMAFGSWFAGKQVDMFLSYRPAFGSGVAFNLLNLAVILFLVSRLAPRRHLTMAAAS
ncbi:MFS transporter [Acidisphaera sp. S103]|uniref:MFS transporter n=1 Tax=Acidisphaera sp. S103 TaxID=1747223 RepID=UPI00131E1832|nr:MFS transporter [Acidisphaera sp. S103]